MDAADTSPNISQIRMIIYDENHNDNNSANNSANNINVS